MLLTPIEGIKAKPIRLGSASSNQTLSAGAGLSEKQKTD